MIKIQIKLPYLVFPLKEDKGGFYRKIDIKILDFIWNNLK
jgi:hypothetical protein